MDVFSGIDDPNDLIPFAMSQAYTFKYDNLEMLLLFKQLVNYSSEEN